MGINDMGVVRAGGSLAVNLGKVRIKITWRGMRLRLRRWQGASFKSACVHQS